VQQTDAQALYTAMDWLGERQAEIEKKLAKRQEVAPTIETVG
jgi:hypothetical protein